jgi:hypothetical protein
MRGNNKIQIRENLLYRILANSVEEFMVYMKKFIYGFLMNQYG